MPPSSTRSSRRIPRGPWRTSRRRRSTTARTPTGSTRVAARTTSTSSCRAMSSSPSALLRAVLAVWPGGVDVVPASTLDAHAFATTRTVAIALDAPLDRRLLLKHYPAATIDGAPGVAGFLILPPRDPYADLASLGAIARIAERLRAAGGCPWDREQTHASLRPHLLEEAY